jgi:tetratricopeptide (TPR) repeat protein
MKLKISLIFLICLIALPALAFAVNNTTSETAMYWMMQGSQLQQNGQYMEAIDAYNNSLMINSNQELVWVLKGSTELMQIKPYDAMKSFDKALQVNPNFAPALGAKAMTYHALGDYQNALVYYNKALAITPTDKNLIKNKTLAEEGKPFTYTDSSSSTSSDFNFSKSSDNSQIMGAKPSDEYPSLNKTETPTKT